MLNSIIALLAGHRGAWDDPSPLTNDLAAFGATAAVDDADADAIVNSFGVAGDVDAFVDDGLLLLLLMLLIIRQLSW